VISRQFGPGSGGIGPKNTRFGPISRTSRACAGPRGGLRPVLRGAVVFSRHATAG
jgi:hypothetical protein